MRVIGTAGHVDHGKSTLVEALTGIHPDRLKEEREREMTIDLGFAWLNLPPDSHGHAEEVGIVDVPGHRDFIENMLAGVGGIDAALFVVAADEGVMPQTREHLAILDLLQIGGGVVALTKIDTVDDPEWLDLIEADLHTALQGTVLAEAPIVRVSARQGLGLEELLRTLSDVLADRPPRPDLNRPRLPVDRTFTVAGFGSVVTGTLTDGHLRVGEEVEILPSGLRGRVRGLQTHKRKAEAAVPGSRTAVNISGVALEDIRRGDVVAHPGDYRPDRRTDVRFRLLPDVSAPLEHNTEVKLFIGAAELVARVRLLGAEQLLPGEEGWLQLETVEPVVAVRGDRYILRRPSPGETLGGGTVVDPHPKGRHKRFAPEVLARLESLTQGSPAEVLLQAALALGAAPLKEVTARSNLDAARLAEATQELLSNGQLLNLDNPGGQGSNDLVIPLGTWQQLAGRAVEEVQTYHRLNPLRGGMPKEELRSRLKGATGGSARLFSAALKKVTAESQLEEVGPLVRVPGHRVHFNPQQEAAVGRLLARFAAAPFTPPSVKESQAEVSEEVFAALLETGRLVAVSPEVAFRREDYERMLADLRRLYESSGPFTAAQVRDHFNASRKYVLALLEHLDAQGVTVREGDLRRLRK